MIGGAATLIRLGAKPPKVVKMKIWKLLIPPGIFLLGNYSLLGWFATLILDHWIF